MKCHPKSYHRDIKYHTTLNIIFSVVSLNQSLGPVYDDLAYDEDPHLCCLEPPQHGWVLDPS